MDTLGDIGECAAIKRLTAKLPLNGSVIVGPGDDCAVVRCPGDTERDWILTSDPVIEGVHFEPGTDSFRVGHKIVGRLLSDLAAMGGNPTWILLDVVAPATLPVRKLERLYDGATRLARRFDAAIVGGDLSSGATLEVHGFAIGWTARDKAVRRGTAMPGDRVLVTGALGGSRSGRHLTFTPRVVEGRWLADWASAMIDVSDGLGTDLCHLAACSGVGLSIEDAAIPLHPDADGVEAAYRDGEDFELCFTVASDRLAAFQQAWAKRFTLPATPIGTVLDPDHGVTRLTAEGTPSPMTVTGFEHFRRGEPHA